MLARNRGEAAEEFIDRVTGLDIVEQGSHGHARAREYRRSAHDVQRSADHAPTADSISRASTRSDRRRERPTASSVQQPFVQP